MNEKKPTLIALTPEAEAAMGEPELVLKHFPFRIGRESRIAVVDGVMKITERRRQGFSAASNDLYLIDRGRPLNVSRQHLQIERSDDGVYKVVDRGSACGTLVGHNHIGGHDRGGESILQHGEVLVVGTSESPFVFRFMLGV